MSDFWDGNIPASLKPTAAKRKLPARDYFWDGNIPASLKLGGGLPGLRV